MKLYREGMTILQLTKKFDFPPMNIFREILTEMGWSKTKIKETLREPSRFKERERKEFEAAEGAAHVMPDLENEERILSQGRDLIRHDRSGCHSMHYEAFRDPLQEEHVGEDIIHTSTFLPSHRVMDKREVLATTDHHQVAARNRRSTVTIRPVSVGSIWGSIAVQVEESGPHTESSFREWVRGLHHPISRYL